jgi:hypothetical protein
MIPHQGGSMTNTDQSVIGHQPEEVRSLCVQFTRSYNKHRNAVAEWGFTLQAIRDSKLNPVNAEGEQLAAEDRNGNPVDLQGNTFSAICRELGVPRSTAYHYINIYLVTKTCPEWLQDASTANNLNLAAVHVQKKFEEIRNLPDYPGRDSDGNERTPNPFEIDGIVKQLKAAKAPTVDSAPLTRDELKEQMERLMSRAKRSGIALQFIHATLEEAIAAAYGTPGAKVTREKAPIYSQQ